ncbi:MAG: [Clostridia bacterium]|nr:[FeFe] hydrogenase H-cluster maturation GTPase HydF [Clostridia bacterium]
MSLNNTPSSERIHIGFFGLRNAGKSSLVNAVTGQSLAVVSDVKGTTTDPVKKAMELLPIGPVVIIDTPGIDDEGTLGEMRVQKAKEVLQKTDIAVLVHDTSAELTASEKELTALFKEKNISCLIAHNKCDKAEKKIKSENEISVSALTGEGVNELKEMIARIGKSAKTEKVIVSDLINAGDTVLLVIPIDKAAPKGRLILPQQMTLRDILDCGATAICCRDSELTDTLAKLKNAPNLVITDSQAFGKVSALLPESVPLTSFSILMARYKGDLPSLMQGADTLVALKDGDRVLISEGCTHHRQCNDIGTVKMPKWIEDYSGAKPEFTFTSGGEFPEDLTPFKLVVHCGGCMLNEKEMQSRIARCQAQNVPMVNYGMAIAKMNGILERSIAPLKQIMK